MTDRPAIKSSSMEKSASTLHHSTSWVSLTMNGSKSVFFSLLPSVVVVFFVIILMIIISSNVSEKKDSVCGWNFELIIFGSPHYRQKLWHPWKNMVWAHVVQEDSMELLVSEQFFCAFCLLHFTFQLTFRWFNGLKKQRLLIIVLKKFGSYLRSSGSSIWDWNQQPRGLTVISWSWSCFPFPLVKKPVLIH